MDGATRVVRVPARDVVPAEEDVLRLAGSASARSRPLVRERVAALTPLLVSCATPAYALAMYAVETAAGGRLALAGGRLLSFGVDAIGAAPGALAALLCTMGEGPDAAETELAAASGPLDAWMFDALVLAALESLELLAWQDAARRAGRLGLYVGMPLVPAVGDLPPAAQHELFACLDATATGVSLDENGTMRPLKSFSCWVPLVGEPTGSDARLHLCESCDLEACRFRSR